MGLPPFSLATTAHQVPQDWSRLNTIRVSKDAVEDDRVASQPIRKPMVQLRPSTPSDATRVLEIWRSAVEATHHFLRPEDRLAIESEVATFLPGASLELAVNAAGVAIGFMLLSANHMEALFIDANHRGSGVGRYLVEAALRRHPNLTVDVNEQNTQAVGFYERMGFERCGRSALDGQGRPYPLIHLRYRPAS